ncbi:radical SAM protein [Desulfonema ishimotonii]|uniref:Radical SAM protein n=1 Tax=Desulfonema ishimotonii TaxID=45657 RepID=A0A401G1L0_9BACT|nr:radical SAM protein [Desulfonema ishimotonii]GBC63110.1 radical SAM protein [Desulfonema ishimotonii]
MQHRKKTNHKNKNQLITALVANREGEIFELEGYAAVGMAASLYEPLTIGRTVPMPYGGELMYLPTRSPIVCNMKTGEIERLIENPYLPGDPIFPVAAFNSPGYVQAWLSAYVEDQPAVPLPLFSYGAVGWHEGEFRSAVICVDSEPRQDLRRMQREKIVAGVRQMRKVMPENRLRKHLEKCALEYGCPAGKNFFLSRYEAPLPTSRACNARCMGCISLQKDSDIPCSQNRISFTPSPPEIAEVALEHIGRVKKSVVSFGQGCEGDPLLAADVIEPAIRRIRETTPEGTINMNTNGSLPDVLEKLFDAGLDSIRVSMNSVREACYTAYFRPAGYTFRDVLKSIDLALGRGKFVAINYLNCPGFTDSPEEAEAFIRFREQHPVHLIQWRNLNFDPIRYWKAMNEVATHSTPIGMKTLLHRIRGLFPDLRYGYFNPPKEKWGPKRGKRVI